MGSSASKPETKVFTPSTAVDFSASFLSQLENSTESDYSRAQYTEKYIQDRVALELAKLEQEAVNRFHQVTKESVKTATTTADKGDKQQPKDKFSVKASNEKLEKLTAAIEQNVKMAKVEVGDEVVAAREATVKCLRENPGKSLNCWEEVEKFKKLVNEL